MSTRSTPPSGPHEHVAPLTERRVVEQVHRLASIACTAAATAYLLWMFQRSATYGWRVVPVVIVLSFFPLIGLSVYIATRRRRPELALSVLAWPMFVMLSALMLAQGGAAGTAIWWLLLVPVATLHAGFLRSGLTMAILLALQTLMWTLLPPMLPAWALIAPATDLQRAIAASGSGFSIALIVASNLHWRFRVRQQLEDARRTADEALDVKARFLAHMSHEIRTPLHGVSGAIDLLRRSRLDAGQQQAFDILDHSNKVLTKWVETLLDHSRLETAQSPSGTRPMSDGDPLFQPAEPHGVARAAEAAPILTGPSTTTPFAQADAAEAAADADVASFGRDGMEARPAAAQGPTARRSRTPEQRKTAVTPAAATSVRGAADKVDAGSVANADAVDAGNAGRIRQASTRSSASSEGTQADASDTGDALPASPMPSDPGRPPRRPPRPEARPFVLLVEDHPVNQLLADTMLDQIGCEVVVASNGREALERFEAARDPPFDLVLMDCQMPVMDGFAASRAIRALEAREQRAHTPIVAMTANSEAEGGPACRAAGMDDYVTKPVAMSRLTQAVVDWTWTPPRLTP